MQRVWFITGAGKGIGKAIATAALEYGDRVIATTRKADGFSSSDKYKDNALNLQLDVSEADENIYNFAVEKGMERFGRIDILVNNAGYGCITNFEETRESSIKDMFEVNVFGMMRVTRAVLPIMRKQRSGHIFNISSGAGYSAGPVPYHTSKFAVTGFSTSLAFEVEPFGIKVTNVAPGLFRTGFYDKGTWRTVPDIHIEDYDSNRWQNAFVKDADRREQPGDPDKLAKLIIEVSNSENPPLHLPVGADAPQVIDSLCAKLKEDTDAWRNKAIDTTF